MLARKSVKFNERRARRAAAGVIAAILCAITAFTPAAVYAEGEDTAAAAPVETGPAAIVPAAPDDAAQADALPVRITALEPDAAGGKLVVNCEVSESYLAANEGKMLYLFKMNPWSTLVINGDAAPLDDVKLKKTEFTLEAGFDGADRFYPYVIAEQTTGGYAEISAPCYVDPALLAPTPAEGADYPVPATKKGLTSADVGEILLTGAANTVVTQAIDRLLAPTAGSGSIPFIFDGNTYYVSREALDSLDAKVKPLSENGVRIYLQLTLDGAWRGTDENLATLYYTGAADGAEGYALNTASATAVTYYCAVCDFLARRYCDPAGEYGCVRDFVIGLCADTGAKNAAGDMQVADAVFAYHKQLRIADAAVRAIDSRARVYAPLSHNWNSRANDSYADYNVKAYLILLARLASSEGQFPFGVALEARASDPASYSIWDDEAAADSADAPYVTMKNIEVICDFLGSDALLCNGGRRALAVTDFAVNSNPDSPSDMSPCASFAYAYYRAAFNDNIDALIWSVAADETGRVYPAAAPTADGEGEPATDAGSKDDAEGDGEVLPVQAGALYLGLSNADRTHKQIYEVFRKIDAAVVTDVNYKEGDSASFALSMIGISSWSEVAPGFGKDKVARYNLAEAMPVLASDIPASADYNYVGTFNDGAFDGFYPAGSLFVELRTVENPSGKKSGMLYAGLKTDGGRDRGGITRRLAGVTAADSGYVTFDIFVEAPAEVASATVEVTVGASAADGAATRFIGSATVKPNSWEQVAFKISDVASVAESIDSLSVFVSSYDGLDHVGRWGVTFDNIAFCGSARAGVGSVVKTVFIILIVIFLLVVVAVMALRAYNTHKAKKRRAERTAGKY